MRNNNKKEASASVPEFTPETFKKSVEKAGIGEKYLIDSKKIEREY